MEEAKEAQQLEQGPLCGRLLSLSEKWANKVPIVYASFILQGRREYTSLSRSYWGIASLLLVGSFARTA